MVIKNAPEVKQQKFRGEIAMYKPESIVYIDEAGSLNYTIFQSTETWLWGLSLSFGVTLR